MNYEAGTEERKGLTKCLNFKRPETILRLQILHGLASVRREFIRTFFVYIAKMKAPPACWDPVQLRPVKVHSRSVRLRAQHAARRVFALGLPEIRKKECSVETWSFDFSKHADVANAASRETARLYTHIYTLSSVYIHTREPHGIPTTCRGTARSRRDIYNLPPVLLCRDTFIAWFT